MKQGQEAGHIFIYILAMVVFSLTLLYGYRAINSFNEQTKEISYVQLEHDIKNEVEKVKADTYGTIRKKVLTIPGNYKSVCFASSAEIMSSFYSSESLSVSSTDYSLINYALIVLGSANRRTSNTMFLYPPGDKGFVVEDIKVADSSNFICINISGNAATIRLESLGDHVQVSRWQ
jgi:hypothetical protein